MAVGDKKNVVMEADVGELVPHLVHAAQHAAGGSDPITPAQIGALPCDGSAAMTGALRLNDSSGTSNDITRLSMYDRNCALRASQDENNYSEIMFSAITDPHFKGMVGGTYFDKTFLHTGNKPSGSYTGNGSAVQRVISFSAVNLGLAVIWANNVFALITQSGGIVRNGNTMSVIGQSQAAVHPNYGLVLATDNAALNANGITYNYQVL